MGMFLRDVRVALCKLGFERSKAEEMLSSECGEIITKRYAFYVRLKENEFSDNEKFEQFYNEQVSVCAEQIKKEF